MKARDQRLILSAVEVLNQHGLEAAVFLGHVLDRPENEDALAWIASLWEPVRIERRAN